MQRIATALRCTDGQAYTVALGLVFALSLLVVGVPPVLRKVGVPAVGAAPARGAEVIASPAEEVAGPTEVPGDPAAEPAPSFPLGPSAAVDVTPFTPSSSYFEPPPSPPSTTRSTGPSPLTIAAAGWTSSEAGSPVAAADVPEDGLPVAARFGAVDKASYLRFAGTVGPLRLRLVEDATANRLVALAVVRACAITRTGWTLGAAAPPDAAPPVDTRRCTEGAQSADGAWTFDLVRIGGYDPAAGVALVPVVEGTSTFQVTFQRVVVAS